jgi:hypothetical protein
MALRDRGRRRGGTRISEAFPEIGPKMPFLFDYGDNCEFRVELIGKNMKEPAGAAPSSWLFLL